MFTAMEEDTSKLRKQLADVWTKYVLTDGADQLLSDKANLITYLQQTYPSNKVNLAGDHFWLDCGSGDVQNVVVIPYTPLLHERAVGISEARIALMLIGLQQPRQEAAGSRFIFLCNRSPVQDNSTFVPDSSDHVFGIAANLQVAANMVAMRRGVAFPSENQFDIAVFNGKTSGKSHSCILAASQLATGLSNLVSRKTDPLTPARIELSDMQVIRNDGVPATKLTCLVTAFGDSLYRDIADLIQKTTSGICSAYALDFEIHDQSRQPLTTFHQAAAQRVLETARSLQVEDNVSYIEYPDTTFSAGRCLFDTKPATVLYYNHQDGVSPVKSEPAIPDASGVFLVDLLSHVLTIK